MCIKAISRLCIVRLCMEAAMISTMAAHLLPWHTGMWCLWLLQPFGGQHQLLTVPCSWPGHQIAGT